MSEQPLGEEQQADDDEDAPTRTRRDSPLGRRARPAAAAEAVARSSRDGVRAGSDVPDRRPPDRLGRHANQSRAGSASLCSTAQSAACVRDARPSLPRMFET